MGWNQRRLEAREAQSRTALLAVALTAKTALIGLSCAGCDDCGADIDSTNGTVKCRSLGCSPCDHVFIVGDELEQALETATW